MKRRFTTCPFCGHQPAKGFVAIEFRWDVNEIWLVDSAHYVIHKHLGMTLPDPIHLARGVAQADLGMRAHRIGDAVVERFKDGTTSLYNATRDAVIAEFGT